MGDINYVTTSSDKKRKTAIILCCLGFVGLAGLHRFYCGKFGTGFVWFCTAGVCVVGTILDLLKLLNGTFTDAAGAPLRK